MPRPVKRPGVKGRPAHVPTDDTRRVVTVMAGLGCPHEDICLAVGVTKPTLYLHYRSELDGGLAIMQSKVMDTAYRLAVSGRCPAMTMFWLKTRYGWRETNRFEIVNVENVPDDRLLSLLERTASSGGEEARPDDPIEAEAEDVQ